MSKKYFKCTFLADIVLNAHTATEGSAKTLNYIPGANFLGIVAKEYQSFGEEAFEVFHSGNVCFSDAHLLHNNQRSWKIPYSWFCKKGDNFQEKGLLCPNRIYIHHDLGPHRENFRNAGTQLKQIRNGFFSENGAMLNPERFFAIKSGYDLEKRRAEDSKIYGYEALRRGSQWMFYIMSDDASLLDKIEEKIKGKHYIGRSRTAQYGKISIESISSPSEFVCGPLQNGKLLLYAESSLTFFNDYGELTLQPDVKKDLKLPEESEILWQDSQIRSRIFAPWNRVRKTRDRDRVCIDKGSVIAVKVPESFNIKNYVDSIKNGIGVYRNEGMGQVLVNPSFLQTDENHHLQMEAAPLTAPLSVLSSAVESDESDQNVLAWAENQVNENKNKATILRLVNEFIKEKASGFSHISPSQWGAVRAKSQAAAGYEKMCQELFEPEKGFLMHGLSSKEWKRRNCHGKLKTAIEEVNSQTNEFYAQLFVTSLCSQMSQKSTKNKKKGG